MSAEVASTKHTSDAHWSRFSIPNFRVPTIASLVGDLGEPLQYERDDYDEDDTIDSASATISDVGSSRVDQQILKETGCMEVQEVQEVQEVSRITFRISSVA